MKFESGFEKLSREEKKAKGEKLGAMDAYKDFNSEPVEELLAKRKAEAEELARRQKEKIEMLEKAEKDGKLTF